MAEHGGLVPPSPPLRRRRTTSAAAKTVPAAAGSPVRRRAGWLVAGACLLILAAVGFLNLRAVVWGQVRPLVMAMHEASIRGDVDRFLSFWTFPTEAYYNEKRRSYDAVRREAGAYYERWSERSGTVHVLKLESWDVWRQRLVVRFRYRYKFVDKKLRAYSGISDTRQVWVRRGLRWRVVATYETVERD